MTKEMYTAPEMVVVEFDGTDVVCESVPLGPGETEEAN